MVYSSPVKLVNEFSEPQPGFPGEPKYPLRAALALMAIIHGINGRMFLC